jgi:hypothetical protein
VPVVIPDLVLIVGLFFAVVGYLAARGLLATWTHSIGFILQWLAVHARIPIPTGIRTFHVDLGGPFRAVDAWAVSALQAWCDGAEIQMGYCLHGLRKVALYTAQAIDFLARETTQTFDWIEHVRLPKWARWVGAAALPAALIGKMIAQAIAHLRPVIHTTTKVIEHELPRTAVRVLRRAAPIVVPGAIALPRIRAEIFGLTKRNLRLHRRLHRVEALFGVTAMAAAMANVFGLPNWRCLTRGNVGRTARALCGLSPRLLDDLLGVLADVWILENVCSLLPLLETAASDIGAPLVEALTVVGSGLCKGNAAPGALRGPSARLPSPVTSGDLVLV